MRYAGIFVVLFVALLFVLFVVVFLCQSPLSATNIVHVSRRHLQDIRRISMSANCGLLNCDGIVVVGVFCSIGAPTRLNMSHTILFVQPEKNLAAVADLINFGKKREG